MSVPATFFDTYAVVGSPADATSTVVATLNGVCTQLPGQSIKLRAWCNVQPGTAGATVTIGIIPGANPATESLFIGQAGVTAEDIDQGMIVSVEGETAPADVAGATYSVILTVASASGASSVLGVHLEARVD